MSVVFADFFSVFFPRRAFEVPQGFVFLISSGIVVVGWYIARLGQIKSDRVKNTSSMIHLFEMPDRQVDLKNIGKFIIKNGSFHEFGNNLAPIESSLAEVLKIIEKTAGSIAVGFTSEQYVNTLNRTFYVHLFMACRAYIASIRLAKRSETIYQNYEILFLRTYFGVPFPLLIWEALRAHPSFRLSLYLFRADYAVLRRLYGLNADYLLEDPERLLGLVRLWRVSRLLLGLIGIGLVCAVWTLALTFP